MHATRRRSLWSRGFLLLVLSVVALALTLTPLASAQVDDGGSATGTGTFGVASMLTLAVTGTPQAATGPVALTLRGSPMFTFTGEARCIAIDETATGFRASIAGVITGGPAFALGWREFQLAVYDNTPSGQPDQVGDTLSVSRVPNAATNCGFDFGPGPTVTGDYIVTPAGACPPGDDANGNGDDDDDDDDVDEGNSCPDEDSDDEDEDDEDDDD